MKFIRPVSCLGIVIYLCGCVSQPQRPIPVRRPPSAPVPPVRTAPVPATPEPVAPRLPAPIRNHEHEPPAAPTLPFRTIVAAQTCLDRNNFSCGVIDGEEHERTRAALRAWQASRGLPVTGKIDAATLARVGNLEAEFAEHVISQEELSALTDFPTGWREKASRARLGYTTLLETVAEKYHASEACIERLNPGVAWPNPPVGTRVVVPKSIPGRYVEAARLEISLSKRELRALDASGKVVALFPCSIARDVSKRPVGELKVVNAASSPTYTFDPEVFAGEQEAAGIHTRLLIPPGPNNPVGMAWIGLDKPGYGIHGTAWPEDIGKTESHGCFRLANWNAQKLIKMVKLGAPVVVEP